MKIIFKRFVAYLIDIFLVFLLSTLLTSNSYINKDYNKYKKTYEEYIKIYDTYQEDIKLIGENYEDKSILEDEYEQTLTDIDNNFNIIQKEYSYKLSKLSIIPSIISILVVLLYFVVIQYCFYGKTLGKKIMKLKVVSSKGKDLTIFNYFLRSLILNSVLIDTLNILAIIFLKQSQFFVYNQIIYVISYVLEVTISLMVIFDKDGRGLHDLVANTKVIGDTI